MERSFRDDLKAAFSVLLGVTLGWLIFARDHSGLLFGAFVGAALMIVGLTVVRYGRRRRKT